MRQSEINEIKNRAVKSAQQFPMIDVLTMCGYLGEQKKRGNNIFYKCTNCNCNGLDKCSINISKNLSYCFNCGTGYGSASLMSSMLDISYIEAALILAEKLGDVSKEEIEKCTRKGVRYDKLVSDSKVYNKIEEKKAEEESDYKAPVYIIDLVYRHMLNLPEFRLDTDSYKYLKNKRNLTDDEIKKSMFFSYKDFFSIDELLKSIKIEEPRFEYNHFRGVPGFSFEFVDSANTRGKWVFKNPYKDCLGIPLTNSEGKIVALQMRYMNNSAINNKKVNKYFFVSSRGNGSFGSSPGSPAHVEYPDVISNSMFIIGEGKFKMMEAAKEGSVSFSCQGVGNYIYVVEEIEDCLKSNMLRKHMNDKIFDSELSFCIMFDADMYENYSVLSAAMGLYRELFKRYNKQVYFLIWDKAIGKGYDDFKFKLVAQGKNFKNFCFLLKGEDYYRKAEVALGSADKVYLSMYKKTPAFRNSKEYGKILCEELWDKQISLEYKSRVNQNSYTPRNQRLSEITC